MKFAAVVTLFLLNYSAHALYLDPGLDANICLSSHILDATVESFTDAGSIRIKINSVLKGTEPPAILERHYGCRDQRMSRVTTLGKRYIFVVDREGKGVRAFMEVRTEKGLDECYIWEFVERDGARATKYSWLSIIDLKQRIERIVQLKP